MTVQTRSIVGITQDDQLRAAGTQGKLGRFSVGTESVVIGTPAGVDLATDVFHPLELPAGPTIVMRTPYGKAGWFDHGVFWASHGYRLVLQDCRGTGESSGGFSYFMESEDGGATASWAVGMPWSDGRIGAAGPSYLGFTALALAASGQIEPFALSVQLMSSDRRDAFFPGGCFALESSLQWAHHMMIIQAANGSAGLANPTVPPIDESAFLHLPLLEADVVQSGTELPLYRERLQAATDPAYWDGIDFGAVLRESRIPMLLTAGWYDLFRSGMWRDYEQLRGNTAAPSRIVVGPWTHIDNDPLMFNSETLSWFDSALPGAKPGELAGDPSVRPSSVKVFLPPSAGWLELPSWPPPEASPVRWQLTGDGGLGESIEGSFVHQITYDPADPTPVVGLSPYGDSAASGPHDNRAVEARSDVLVYTSGVLADEVTIAGPVETKLWVGADAPEADFFVRLTDVLPSGESLNVCEGIARVAFDREAAGSPVPISVSLGSMAFRFAAGHRLRLQVAGGAFPVFARNLGYGEPDTVAVEYRSTRQSVYLAPEFPSGLAVYELSSVHATDAGAVES
jgi:putative CocE/NonD family hydrolase